jgi:ATP-dependent DNA helicase Q4
LQAQTPSIVRVLPQTAITAKVSFYAAPPEELVDAHPVVRAALAVSRNPRNGVYSVSTAKLATAMQKAPGVAVQDLQVLAAQKLIGFELTRERGLAYEVLVTPPNLNALADTVQARLLKMLHCQIGRLDTSYKTVAAAAAETQPALQEASLRTAIDAYFDAPISTGEASLCVEGLPLRNSTPALITAAKAVLRRNSEQAGPTLTPRAIARILHGVGSPGFPRDQWAKRMTSFWGSHKATDFQAVLNAATIACREIEQPT